jgi:FtsH-binding integral membrane protein
MTGFIVTLCLMIITVCILNFIIGTEFYYLAAMGLIICLLSVYIIWDTQMIIGGKKRYQFSIDDYVIAAMILYSDIITIFLYILQLFGSSD